MSVPNGCRGSLTALPHSFWTAAHLIKTVIRLNQSTIRKITSDDLDVGLICADRDGNRVRIDRVDREIGIVAYHFLNDELRVQEGVREVPIDAFLSEAWYLA